MRVQERLLSIRMIERSKTNPEVLNEIGVYVSTENTNDTAKEIKKERINE